MVGAHHLTTFPRLRAYIIFIHKTQMQTFTSSFTTISRALSPIVVSPAALFEPTSKPPARTMLALLLALLPLAASADQCVKPEPDAGFTNAAYEGTWYEVGKIQTPDGGAFPKDCVCDALKFYSEQPAVSGWGRVDTDLFLPTFLRFSEQIFLDASWFSPSFVISFSNICWKSDFFYRNEVIMIC